MARRIAKLAMILVALALTVASVSPSALAQGTPVDRSIDDTSSDLGESFVSPDVQPSTADTNAGSGGASSTGALANSGSDIEPIIAISVGLLAVGGSALVSSRRRLFLG